MTSDARSFMLPQPAPPGFAQASNLRQKSPAAVLAPDYWYSVEFGRMLKHAEAIGEVNA